MKSAPSSDVVDRPVPRTRLVDRLLVDEAETAGTPQSFESYARRTALRLIQALTYFGAGLAVAFWPMDFIVFSEDPRRLRISFAWRSIVVLGILLLYLVSRRARRTGEGLLGAVTGLYLGIVGVTFVTAGLLGDLTTPWFYCVFVIPLFTTMMLVGWAKRLLLIYAGIGMALAGYFAVLPDQIHYQHLSAFLGILLAVCLIYGAVGHMLYSLIRANFENRQELRRLSQVDPLTGVYNHGHLRTSALHEIARARRSGEALSLLMLDVDRFKEVNDSFGHEAGDTLLKRVAELLRQSVREIDFVGRLGGDEFAIVLPRTPLALAMEVAERIRRAVEATQAVVPSTKVRFSISIGCAELAGSDEGPDALLRRADRALYDAKATGRNRVSAGREAT